MNTKIALSDKELELVCATEWILTKHIIVQKVYELFGAALPSLTEVFNDSEINLPDEVFTNSPKISKGENYKRLPYVMLDYPRCFGKEDTIAIRTFFWWGNFFSVSLQLGGKFKINAIDMLLESFAWLQQNEYAVCANDNPWEHHFDESNFVQLKSVNKNEFVEMLKRKPFVKIAKNIPVSKWGEVPVFIVKTFTELAGLLKSD